MGCVPLTEPVFTVTNRRRFQLVLNQFVGPAVGVSVTSAVALAPVLVTALTVAVWVVVMTPGPGARYTPVLLSMLPAPVTLQVTAPVAPLTVNGCVCPWLNVTVGGVTLKVGELTVNVPNCWYELLVCAPDGGGSTPEPDSAFMPLKVAGLNVNETVIT